MFVAWRMYLMCVWFTESSHRGACSLETDLERVMFWRDLHDSLSVALVKNHAPILPFHLNPSSMAFLNPGFPCEFEKQNVYCQYRADCHHSTNFLYHLNVAEGWVHTHIVTPYWLKIMMLNVFAPHVLNITSGFCFLKKMLTNVPRYCNENVP